MLPIPNSTMSPESGYLIPIMVESWGRSERVPIQTDPTPQNIEYLRTKREKLGHRSRICV